MLTVSDCTCFSLLRLGQELCLPQLVDVARSHALARFSSAASADSGGLFSLEFHQLTDLLSDDDLHVSVAAMASKRSWLRCLQIN